MSEQEKLKNAIISGEDEKIRDSIRATIRQAISTNVNETNEEDEELTESFAAIVGLAGLGAGWGWIRNKLRKFDSKNILEAFLKEHDENNIISEKLPQTLKRFKIVGNLSDLEEMERKIDNLLGQIENMSSKVDGFVEKAYRDEKTLGDKVFIRNPKKEKQRLKQFIDDFVQNSKQSFEREVEKKKDELLA